MTYNYQSVTIHFLFVVDCHEIGTCLLISFPRLRRKNSRRYLRVSLHSLAPLLRLRSPHAPLNQPITLIYSKLEHRACEHNQTHYDCKTSPYLLCAQKTAPSLAVELEIIFQTSITPSVNSIFRSGKQFGHSKSSRPVLGPLWH